MRGFKRLISAVLVISLVFGLAASAGASSPAGAEKYLDYSEIRYTDAVDVLTELEILDGFSDGCFHPEQNLTREQVAKVVAYISVQPQLTTAFPTAEQFLAAYVNVCDEERFVDVEPTRWSAGAIGYDRYSGIVCGRDETHFVPDGNVRVIEVAKMLLVALGYDSVTEGYENSNWAANIITAAMKKGIFDGIDITPENDVYRDATRDEMAQMTYNMLIATMVGYYAEYDKATGAYELTSFDQINDITGVYGNNVSYWKNCDAYCGKQAIQYYFGKEVDVTFGIVVANEYANFGQTSLEGVVDCDETGKYMVSYGGISVYYDAADETVIYIPAGKCIGTGYCSGQHNDINANCPMNTDIASLVVIPTPTSSPECYETIGREVKLTAVNNIMQSAYYDTMVVTASNNAEAVTMNGSVNDASGAIDLAPDTLEVGIFNCGAHSGENPQQTDLRYADGYEQWLTENIPGYIHYLIDNNDDGLAEFAVCIEEQFTGDALEHTGIGGYKISDPVELRTGQIISYVGNALEDGDYSVINIDGVDYTVSGLCTASIRDNFKWSIYDICEYWLDHGGNVVKFKLTDPAADVSVLIYGIERTSGGKFRVHTIDSEGTKTAYELDHWVDFRDGAAEAVFDNSRAIFATLSFNRDGEVVAVTPADATSTVYTKGTLILGKLGERSKSNSVLYTSFDEFCGVVDDTTRFYNFETGSGSFVLASGEAITDSSLSESTWNAIVPRGTISVGDVVITTGPASVNAGAADEVVCIYGDNDLATDVIVTSSTPYSAFGSVSNTPVNKLDEEYGREFVYITESDVTTKSRIFIGEATVLGVNTYLYTIPVSGERSSITVTNFSLSEIEAVVKRYGSAIFSVEKIPGLTVDTVVYFFTVDYEGARVCSVSPELDRIGVIQINAPEYDESFGEEFTVNYNAARLFGTAGNDIWTSACTEDTIVYRITEDGMTRVTAEDIAVGDAILYHAVGQATVLNGQIYDNTRSASVFADTVSVAFISDMK